MVTDCLAPIVTPEGVGTIVTCNKKPLLTEGLTFAETEIETFITNKSEQYWILFNDNERNNNKVKKNVNTSKRRLLLTVDAMLLSSEGWKTVKQLKHLFKYRSFLIRVLQHKCLSCGKWYNPVTPVIGICSPACKFARLHTGLTLLPLNKKTIDAGYIREHWLSVDNVGRVYLNEGVEAVRIKNIIGGNSIYINGILISLQSLIHPGIMDNNNSE